MYRLRPRLRYDLAFMLSKAEAAALDSGGKGRLAYSQVRDAIADLYEQVKPDDDGSAPIAGNLKTERNFLYPETKRPIRVHLRITRQQNQMVEFMSSLFDATKSEVVRLAIYQFHQANRIRKKDESEMSREMDRLESRDEA